MKTLVSFLFLFFALSFPIYGQQAINYGETLTGSISPAGEVDIYTFSGIQNEKVIIRLTENPFTSALDPLVELFDPSASLLISVSDASQAEIKITLPATGTYTIFVSDEGDNNTGNYALFIQRLVNPGNSTLINYGETLTGSISTQGDVDTYSFSGTAGDKMILHLTENPFTSALDPLVELFDPAGDSLLAVIDAAQVQIEITLPTNGSYTILVSNPYPGANTGNYALFIQRLVNPGNSTLINYGETLTGSISPQGDVDTYSFLGAAGDSVIIRLTENPFTPALEPFVELFDPSGDSLLAVSDDVQAEIGIRIQDVGFYTILASDSYPGDDTGNYSIFLFGFISSQILAFPSLIEFGDIPVGQIANDSFIVFNRGASPVNIDSITVNGINPANFSVDTTFFTLDPGDSLSVSVGFAPDTLGIFSATLNISSTGGNATVNLNGTGVFQEFITVTSPNGGENWQIGSNQNITWTSSGTSGLVDIDLSTDGGATYLPIFTNIADDSSEAWTVSNTPSDSCLIRITDNDGSPSDVSDSLFTISVAPQSITVTSPNGGENWSVGSSQNITWTSSGTSALVDIDLSTDGGVSFSPIFSNITDDGLEPWTVSNTPSDSCLIRITDNDGSPSDVSDSLFTISGAGLVHFNPVAPTGDPRPVVIQNATIDSLPIVSGDEIGVFDDTLCVGAGSFSGTYPLTITIWMEVNLPGGGVLPGATAGNPMSFKMWQMSSDTELPGIPTYTTGSGILGEALTVVNPLNGVTTVTQTIPVKAGQINLISFNMLPPDLAVETMFDDLDSLLVAQDDQGQFYIPPFAVNTICNVDITDGYQVFITGAADDTVMNAGPPLVPEDYSQALTNTQLYMIDYPYQDPFAIEDVLAAITPSVLVVQDDLGQFWIPSFAVNTIGNMQPGKGYQIFVTQTVNFTYPATSTLSASLAKAIPTTPLSAPKHFEYQRTGLPYGVLVTGSEQGLKSGDEIAVFDGDLCVGAAVFTGEYPLVIPAWEGHEEYGLAGFKSGNNIALRVWQASDAQEVDALASFANFSESTFRGGPISALSISSLVSPESIPSTFALDQNYPNPFNPETRIRYHLPEQAKVTLTVYNLQGQVIRKLETGNRKAGSHQIVWDSHDDNGRQVASGVYFYRLQAGNFTAVKKLILMK